MAKKPSLIKWVIVSIILLLLLIVVFISLAPVGKQQTPVDYIAEYNRINKPDDFDPNDNAAPYFDKAFAIMAESPSDITKLYKLWPGDMNGQQLQTARQWVESNRQTLDYLHQAVQKPYSWKPIKAKNYELLIAADLNDLAKFRKSALLLCLDVKLKAQEGQIESALRQLTEVYKIGTFFTGPKILIEQVVGTGIRALAVRSALQILDHINLPSVVLEDFQRKMFLLSRERPFLMDFTAERLIFYEHIENQYVNNKCFKITENPDLYFKNLFFRTIGRPWLTREKHKADLMYDYFDAARLKTPYQFRQDEGSDLKGITDKMTKGTLFLRIIAPSLDRTLLYSYKDIIQTDALITTTAILRYKAEKGHLPQDLQTLVTDGFLDKLPMDPFSDGPLVYKLSNDNFILYSFAQDFNDNGGKHDTNWASENNGDFVFWPVQPVQTPAKTNKSD